MGLIQRSCTFRSCVDHADLGACRAWPGPPPGRPSTSLPAGLPWPDVMWPLLSLQRLA